MSDLVERLRKCDEYFSGDDHEVFAEAADEIERLRAALQWEAACAGDECAYERGQFCFEYEPESPDLWCTYCRITAALKGVDDE